MLRSIQQRDLQRNRWIKITMSVILVLICASMLLYLIPGLNTGSASGPNADVVATVGGQDITVVEVQRQLSQAMRGQNIPDMLRGLYAQQILDQLVFQRALEVEGDRLGLRVTPEEETQRIKQILPSAFNGDTWMKDRYTAEVQMRTGMTVPEFENYLRNQMLFEKFRELVTDGLSVTPAEIEQEFRWRNEKVTVQFALIKAAELAAAIQPTDAELNAYFQKNASKYQVPERRSIRYAMLDQSRLRAQVKPSESELRAYYNAHINEYKVDNRVHVEHILFKTIGKTDAEIAEIEKKAEDVLKQAKKGANFEELAKKYSEDDATKPKGGDLGWIVEKQTVPEFEKVAFSLPKGSISDLVKTQYGFHIIKVLDRETAHTKSFEEVRDSITPIVAEDKARAEASKVSNDMAAAVRQSNRQSLDDLAKKFNLSVGEVPPVAATEPLLALGSSPDLMQAVFQLRPGELSQPLQLQTGYAIITVKEVLPAHQGTLEEVRDRVLADYQKEKSLELARSKAEELSKRAASEASFEQAAKALGLTVKTTDPFARNGSIPEIGTAKELQSAFGMAVGQVSPPQQVSGNWVVFKAMTHVMPNPVDFPAQKDMIQAQLLQAKQSSALEAFRTALLDRLKKEGKLTENPAVLKRLTRTS
jgi:peptidyl-prolyl cis-trans isomerase D